MSTKAGRTRLDKLLVERGLVESRARAQALILAGKVIVDERRRDKAGEQIASDAEIRVNDDHGWASRGAGKLLGALKAFPWLVERIEGASCLDIGASTGGFTDVLLRHGAQRVVALDVGYGQLHWRLQSDERVHIMDRTNIRHLTPGDLPWPVSLVTCDASFISVRLFLAVVWRELSCGGTFVVLVKPQFELGRERVGKGGIVRDDADRQDAAHQVQTQAEQIGFVTLAQEDAAVAGPKGNQEIIMVFEKPETSELEERFDSSA